MNILMLRPQIELGGVSAHIKLLASGLRETGQQVSVAASGGEWKSALESAGIAVFTFPLYPSTPLHLARSALRLRHFVRINRIELLHSHHRFTTIVGRMVQRLTNVPLIATVHEFKMDGQLTAPLWAGNMTIAPSQALKAHLVSFYGARGDRVFVIPHAIEIDCVSGKEPRATALPIAASSVTIGYIGRLSPEKGARYFLESIPLIRRRYPDIQCVIAGDGPEAAALRRLADNLGLDSAQVFLGARQDIGALLETLDVVVIPSLSESFSMVALEAMRAARPVVAAAVGGLPEVVRDGETGLLATPASPDSLSEKIGMLLVDPELRRRLGARGRQVLKEEHTPALMVARTLDAYRAARSAGKR
jgi:glycosyltransferase involved in cell wall biosynthesis